MLPRIGMTARRVGCGALCAAALVLATAAGAAEPSEHEVESSVAAAPVPVSVPVLLQLSLTVVLLVRAIAQPMAIDVRPATTGEITRMRAPTVT